MVTFLTNRNLLEETLEVLKENGKSPNDVVWVGCEEFYTTWENFERVANINYYPGYGSQLVAYDLMIVGADWWLERADYDGSEWWEFKALPKQPETKKVIKFVQAEQAEIKYGPISLENLNK